MKRAVLIVFFFGVLSCGEVPLYERAESVEPYSDGFESGISEDYGQGAAREDSIAIVHSPVRQGTNALRFTIYPGDYAQKGSRSELSYDNRDPIGSEAWYGWSIYLESNYVDSGAWQIMGQWHDQPDYLQGETWDSFPGNSPPIAVAYTNGIMYLDLNYPADEDQRYLFTNVNRGEWIDVAVHIKWSLQEDGFAEFYVNGAQVGNPSNNSKIVRGRTLWNRSGNYFKFGIYRGPEATATNVLYYDELRIGNSLSDVSIP